MVVGVDGIVLCVGLYCISDITVFGMGNVCNRIGDMCVCRRYISMCVCVY